MNKSVGVGVGWSVEARSSGQPGREALKDALALEEEAELQPGVESGSQIGDWPYLEGGPQRSWGKVTGSGEKGPSEPTAPRQVWEMRVSRNSSSLWAWWGATTGRQEHEVTQESGPSWGDKD